MRAVVLRDGRLAAQTVALARSAARQRIAVDGRNSIEGPTIPFQPRHDGGFAAPLLRATRHRDRKQLDDRAAGDSE
jgi:hypothetical protein